MGKLWLTVMAFGAILAVIPSDATAQETRSKQSAQTAPAQPAAEGRKKRAVLGNVIPVTSGQRPGNSRISPPKETFPYLHDEETEVRNVSRAP
jgi:hypothetical protein